MSLLAAPFPQPGPGLAQAYRDLDIAQHGTPKQRAALGDVNRLPRPWVPDNLSRSLRRELWDWLDDVVPWINEHHTWQIGAAIPICWDRHPHLVLELTTVTDLRYRAARSLTGDALEDWHRYCLPAFLDRMTYRLHGSCDTKHTTWPGRPRHARFETEREHRWTRLRADLDTWGAGAPARPTSTFAGQPTTRPYRVDPDTGEIVDDE
ncbi:hypothetical protein BJF86_13215 [Serinicoccus sp. CNJ-927]|uniref:hypothetical protein n=1 Tax=Serinicoccus sp. CNJ-927 TaxID=1904970 RepID=UPI000963A390|nr:hypothetical protein [Serinicoccus sp. CNJ-927]OLT43914.1 hypothetical protein BJF86_13215 [Serinicoccus sp. CNJ-927]